MLAVVCALAALLAPAAAAFSPQTEALNFAKVSERERYITLTPAFLVELHLRSTQALLERTRQVAEDPERLPANACGVKGLECAGDIRFHDWPERGDGIRKSVLFTARRGRRSPAMSGRREAGRSSGPGW